MEKDRKIERKREREGEREQDRLRDTEMKMKRGKKGEIALQELKDFSEAALNSIQI